MEWLKKQRLEVINDYKLNKISLADAANKLTQLGIHPLKAWDILQKI